MMFKAVLTNNSTYESYFYSIGGGFVVKEGQESESQSLQETKQFPFPIHYATELQNYCEQEQKDMSSRYKETSTGGLALQVMHTDC